jgi:mono/diheme cytochrome c family protein/rhodanese-related sulfurtransferase
MAGTPPPPRAKRDVAVPSVYRRKSCRGRVAAMARSRRRRSDATRLALVLIACNIAVFVAAGGARAEGPAPAAVPPAAVGAALYARYCKLCHAADATGYAADNAPSLVSRTFLGSAGDAFIARGIRLGRPLTAMAAYGKERGGPLDDSEIAAIVAFLRSKGPSATPLPERKAAGSAARGSALYSRECRSCHGTASEGGKAPHLYNSEFLAAASPAFLRHAILHGRPPTRMPAFEKRLSSGEVDDLVAWLVSQRRAVSAKPIHQGPPDNLPAVIHPEGKAPEFTLRDERFVAAAQVELALREKRRMIIIDARSPSDWIQFHIPGAISLPYYSTAELDRLPKDDGTWVVAYCACPHHASGEVVDALRRRGYTHTAVLDEGILSWRQSNYPLAGEAVSPATPSNE